jgi:type VI secretion system secreted protein VgrG
MFESFKADELAKMGFSPTGGALPNVASVAPSTVSTHPLSGSADRAYPAPPPQNDRPADCSYFDGSKMRIDAPAGYYTPKNTVQLSPGKPVQADFPSGGTASAMEYDAIVVGKKVPIFAPTKSPQVGTALARPDQLAEAIGKLPAPHLENINRVIANADPNPDDSRWAETYKNPNFYSAATANTEQGVAFFP